MGRPKAPKVVIPLPKLVTASAFLLQSSATLELRGKTYDTPSDDPDGGERSMNATVTAFNAITGKHITEPEGWLLLQILKDVRQWKTTKYHEDSALDSVAYAALKAESLATEVKE